MKKRKKKTKERRRKIRAWRRKINKYKVFDSRCLDGRKLLVRELKLVYAIRATRVPKSEFFIEVPKDRGFSYTGYFLPNGHVRTILV